MLIDRGHVLLEQHKRLLPFYDVFDEQRYFRLRPTQKVVELDGVRLAITICEDAWNDKNFWPRRLYPIDPDGRADAPAIRRCISISLRRRSGTPSAHCAARCWPPLPAATAFPC